jgi:aspartyl-tRNA synthetase
MRILNSQIVNKENEEVELMGWVANRRDHGKIIFVDLRDRSGISQLVFTPENKQVYETADKLRSEWVIKVKGIVKKRPPGLENPNLTTGQYEIGVNFLEILSQAKTLPFDISNEGYEINEEIRMKYRYLDLRRERMKKNLKTRAQIIKFIRDFLTEKEFIEIETPILSKSTPEGARDYLVPSRLQPGKFYALPQSPQQYKQLLMVAGIENYFQIAKCFRDEDTRGDRQPEFTQLDIEMSFVSEEDILNLIEELYVRLIKAFYPQKKIYKIPFPRLNYYEVMEKYGSDKPDLREDKNNPDELAFAFIVNFPMFEWKETEKRWDVVHHPFTKIKRQEDKQIFIEKLKTQPENFLAHQYDLVLNGYEIGGGSVRETDPDVLKTVFEIMGNKIEDLEDKFGHLFEAFHYGVPPHAGIASGLDRLMAILENEPNIREVIAFPKTGDGRDLMMNAPAEVELEQLKELHLEIKNNKSNL